MSALPAQPRRRARTTRRAALSACALVALSAVVTPIATARAGGSGTWTRNPPSTASAHAVRAGEYALSGAVHPSARRAGPAATVYAIDRAATIQASRSAGSVPSVPSTPLATSPRLPVNIDAASSNDSFVANYLTVEPPDQGLCVGAGTVLETINEVLRVYSANGAAEGPPVPMSSVFAEPTGSDAEFLSDPRCEFDAASATFILTDLAIDSSRTLSHLDIGVMPAATGVVTTYRLDTTDATASGCPCFGDQPRLGLDSHNVYVASDEYAIDGPAFGGSEIFAVSRADLEALATAPRAVEFKHIVDGGIPVLGLQPAVTSGRAPAEFFAHSFVVDATGAPRVSDDRIGVFAMTSEGAVASGRTPTLSAPAVIAVGLYAQPVGAVNTNGLVLNADDDRLQQLQYSNGHLWTTLSTAVHVGGSLSLHDGVAWMELTVGLTGSSPSVTVAGEGRIGSRGVDLLYPAIATNAEGAAAIALSLTSQTLNPSVGYLTRAAGSKSWRAVFVAATGTGPENGFTCTLGSTCRWGDYSAIAVDRSTGMFWAAGEYIPPLSSQSYAMGGGESNWGTRLFELG